MREVQANLWKTDDADAICIPTNGVQKRNGEAVMGAGVARQARDRHPELPSILGNMLAARGNNVHDLGIFGGVHIVSFPTKDDWRDTADPFLIHRSAIQLSKLVEGSGWAKVGLPRPGCGLGGLLWTEVKPILEATLDDRFYIVDVMP